MLGCMPSCWWSNAVSTPWAARGTWGIYDFLSLKFAEAILCKDTELNVAQVGEFYEAVGLDAVLLVEHCGLNPMGSERDVGHEYVPRAGCRWEQIRLVLKDLTQAGFSVVCSPLHAWHRPGGSHVRILLLHPAWAARGMWGICLSSRLGADLPGPQGMASLWHSVL